nr:iron-sulfur cluster repair di-iron protein [Saprospiraceae bacterium]
MKNQDLLTKKVGRIVADDFRTAAVFSNRGIDFCCSGGITLQEACEANQVPSEAVVEELNKLDGDSKVTTFKNMNQEELINHVIKTHHQYVTNALPVLKAYLDKLCKVHGENHPELFEIRDEFGSASNELTMHMKKEEMILFPYLIAMYRAEKDNYPLSPPHFGHVDNPIKLMEEEHDTEGARFRRINKLSSGYTPPPGACQTYKVAYAMLSEFESDLHTHIHIENNLIFPVAREMYDKVCKN